MEISRENKQDKEKAGFTMGEYDYARYNALILEVETLNKMILMENIQSIKPFYVCLRMLWKNFRAISDKKTRKYFDALMKNAEALFEDWKKRDPKMNHLSPKTLIKVLDNLFTTLLEYKQKLGLGIPTRPDTEGEETLR